MLFVAQIAEAVTSAMRAAVVRGRVAVIDEPRLARALRDRGAEVVTVGARLRALKKSSGVRICAAAETLPIRDASVAAVVAIGVADSDGWEPAIARYIDAVADDGLIVLVDRAAPSELSRRALCGGLAQIEQRQAGRTIITSGRVKKLS